MATSTQTLPAQVRTAGQARPADVTLPGWVRFFKPSFADCFFIALMGWLFICGAAGWKSLLMDGDTGWHIRTGEYILDHHAVPTQDLFSFSRPDQPWFAWEWLSDVVYAVLFRIGGLKAISLLAGTMIAIFATVVLRYAVWRGANALVAAFATFLAVGSASIHFLARPHLFTLLLLPVCMWMLEADRRKQSKSLWWLVPITALWTNLHGGFPIFLVCLGLLVAGTLIEKWMGRPRGESAGRYAALFVACSAASLLNPYGIQLHIHMIEFLRSGWIRTIVQEFQAPQFRSESQSQFEILLLAGLILTGLFWKRRMVTESLWILFLAHSSLTSARHAPLFAAVAAPLIASEITIWWKSAAANLKKSSALRIIYQLGEDLTPSFRWTSIWPALLVLVLVFLDEPVKWARQFPTEGFPVAMIQENSALLQSGRLLTTDQWGDFMIYEFYPRMKVFVDGRSDFYGESLGKDYLHLLQGAYDWDSILQKYRFEVALLPIDLPLTSLLKRTPSWHVVRDDGRTILLQRLGQ